MGGRSWDRGWLNFGERQKERGGRVDWRAEKKAESATSLNKFLR